MAHLFGFFDVDNREMDPASATLTFRPRVGPIVSRLQQIYALAERKGYPLVFTVCCSGRMPAPLSLPGTLFIPTDASDHSWRSKLSEARRFHLAKITCGNPQDNLACRAYDMFCHNANASLLLRELDVQTWVLFGNGFDLCVGSAGTGILNAGLSLIVLDDVRISCTGASPESEAATLCGMRDRGARVMSLEAFMRMESA